MRSKMCSNTISQKNSIICELIDNNVPRPKFMISFNIGWGDLFTPNCDMNSLCQSCIFIEGGHPQIVPLRKFKKVKTEPNFISVNLMTNRKFFSETIKNQTNDKKSNEEALNDNLPAKKNRISRLEKEKTSKISEKTSKKSEIRENDVEKTSAEKARNSTSNSNKSFSKKIKSEKNTNEKFSENSGTETIDKKKINKARRSNEKHLSENEVESLSNMKNNCEKSRALDKSSKEQVKINKKMKEAKQDKLVCEKDDEESNLKKRHSTKKYKIRISNSEKKQKKLKKVSLFTSFKNKPPTKQKTIGDMMLCLARNHNIKNKQNTKIEKKIDNIYSVRGLLEEMNSRNPVKKSFKKIAFGTKSNNLNFLRKKNKYCALLPLLDYLNNVLMYHTGIYKPEADHNGINNKMLKVTNLVNVVTQINIEGNDYEKFKFFHQKSVK